MFNTTAKSYFYEKKTSNLLYSTDIMTDILKSWFHSLFFFNFISIPITSFCFSYNTFQGEETAYIYCFSKDFVKILT